MSDEPRSTFIDVQLEPCAAAPDGITLRFKTAAGKAGEPRAVQVVPYESEAGVGGDWRVSGATGDDDDAPLTPARAALVEDSSDGTAWLIVGGEAGVRLEHVETGAVVREPYLVLSKGTALR